MEPSCLSSVLCRSDSDLDAPLPRNVDAVTGRVKESRPEPHFASEEEREASAAELVHLLRRLNDNGIIRCDIPGVTDAVLDEEATNDVSDMAGHDR